MDGRSQLSYHVSSGFCGGKRAVEQVGRVTGKFRD